jgi:hypothetical protein
MEHSHSWEADSSSASQEISYILWNLKLCAQDPDIYPYPEPH